jgi:hypothetical protein
VQPPSHRGVERAAGAWSGLVARLRPRGERRPGPRRAGLADREAVDFLGIGTQKAGTSWIVGNLKAHPSVWTPIVKEIHFFDVLHVGTSRADRLRLFEKRCRAALERARSRVPPDQALIDHYTAFSDPGVAYTDDWYRGLFGVAGAGQKAGEYTPMYCAIGRAGIEHLRRLAPSVRLIYVIREPEARAVSSLSMLAGFERNPSQQRIVASREFRIRGDYAGNVPLWDEHFGDQVLYLPFRQIAEDPLGTMRRIEAHIGVEPFDGYPSLYQKNNSHTGKLAVEPEVAATIRRQAEPQRAFLAQRFGEDFLRMI